LDVETARTIRTLIAARRWAYNEESVAKLIAEWTAAEWEQLDAEYQAAADEAKERYYDHVE
jgi:hypothetical protein